MAKVQKTRKRRVKKNIARGCAHIHSTFNNTNRNDHRRGGKCSSMEQCRSLRIQGKPKEHTICSAAGRRSSRESGNGSWNEDCERRSKRTGPGREAAVRALQVAGLDITMINDVTPIPHNGCRPPKRPRG